MATEVFWSALDPSGDYGLYKKYGDKNDKAEVDDMYKQEARDIWSSLSGGAMGLELRMSNLDIEGKLTWYYRDDLSTYTSTVALTGNIQTFKAAVHMIIRSCVDQIIDRHYVIKSRADYTKHEPERLLLYKQITEYFKL